MEIQTRLAPLLEQLQEHDCRAIWLAGSYVTDDPTPFSDVDLGVISASGRRNFELRAHADLLVSISAIGEAAMLQAFNEPSVVGAAIPGWRGAVLLHDPDGIAANIKRHADEWNWDSIASSCDRWCAEQAARSADWVLKLASARARQDDLETARCRNALAVSLPPVMSVKHRLLYGSERNLVPAVNAALGETWARDYAFAIGATESSLETTVHAAYWLYALVAEAVEPCLDSVQRAVVSLALKASLEGSE